MIDALARKHLARRLKEGAKQADPLQGVSRYYDGWRISLTYGNPTPEQARAFIVEKYGKEFADKIPQNDLPAEHDWHLSASWRGNHPVEDGKIALAELLVALGVPEDKRAGEEFARVAGSPQVTHWLWKEES